MKLRFGSRPSPRSAPASPGEHLLSGDALRILNRLKLNTGPYLPGISVGHRPSSQRHPSVDFRDHRMYAPGDDVRFVDWKASARQEHVYIRQGEQQKEARIYLLIDLSASMRWGEPPKSNAALALAAALGYLALGSGDRLVVEPVFDRSLNRAGPKPLGPISGKGQFAGLLNYLRSLPFRGQVDMGPTLASLRKRGSSGGGLVLVLSDLLGVGDLSASLEALPRPKWRVVILHQLHPAELDPTLQGDLELQDIENGQKKKYTITPKALETYRQRLEGWRAGIQEVCTEKKAVYTLLPTGWSLENETLPHLRSMNIVQPL